MHHLVEVDPVLSRVSVHLANFLEIPFDVYPQDAIMPLPFEDARSYWGFTYWLLSS